MTCYNMLWANDINSVFKLNTEVTKSRKYVVGPVYIPRPAQIDQV